MNAMNVVSLSCKGCSAALPAPTGPTVQCEYCGASFVVERPRGGVGSAALATKDHPAHVWLPLSRPVAEVHLWLLEKAAATPFIDPEFVRALSTQPFQQRSEQVWFFTAQVKGGFTAMVGVDESRVVAQKHGNDIRNVTVRETRWTPFSSQLRLSRVCVCAAGGALSDAVADVLRDSGDLSALVKQSTPWEAAQTPQLNAETAWGRQGQYELAKAQEIEAQRLMQGDHFKNVKFNVDTSWQPAVVAVEIRTLAVGSFSYDCVSVNGTNRLLSKPSFPQSEGQVAQHRALRKQARKALTNVVLFVLGCICTLGLLAFWKEGRDFFQRRRAANEEFARCRSDLQLSQANEVEQAKQSIQALYGTRQLSR